MRYRFGRGMRLDLVLTIFAVAALAGCRWTPERSEILVGTVVAAFSVVIALLLSPETKGKELTAELVVA